MTKQADPIRAFTSSIKSTKHEAQHIAAVRAALALSPKEAFDLLSPSLQRRPSEADRLIELLLEPEEITQRHLREEPRWIEAMIAFVKRKTSYQRKSYDWGEFGDFARALALAASPTELFSQLSLLHREVLSGQR